MLMFYHADEEEDKKDQDEDGEKEEADIVKERNQSI